MIISSLNYSSIKTREKEEAERKRKSAKAKEKERQQQAQYTTPSRDQGVQAGGGIQTGSYEESLG